MKINRQILESFLGKKVEVKLFDRDIFVGELHKIGEERYKGNNNLYLPKNWYLVEYDNYSIWGDKEHSCLFRVSHITRIKEVLDEC